MKNVLEMNKGSAPNEEAASDAVARMTNEAILSVNRMPTGDQNHVFAVMSDCNEYVIRMTTPGYRFVFQSALYWQSKLIRLGVPLARFIKHDINSEYSDFPSLLMRRLPGNDLCNIYYDLDDIDKKNLAVEMTKIQSLTNPLPQANGFGIASSYEEYFKFQSWYDFITCNLVRYITAIENNQIYDSDKAKKALFLANELEANLRSIQAKPFLWDASERNVIVHDGKISGIVDVDEICFGDHLLVLGLTSAGLKVEGHDDLYVQYWADSLQLDKHAQRRLKLYKLFYCLAFMSKHSTTSVNESKIVFDTGRLNSMFEASL